MVRIFSPFAVLAFGAVLLCPLLAFAADVPPPDPAEVLALVRSGGWLTLGILVIPWLDDRIGKADAWPFSIAMPAAVRIVAIAVGGAVVVALTRLQAKAPWLDALVSGIAAALFALAKQSGSLFPVAAASGVVKAASKRPPPMPPGAVGMFALLVAGVLALVTGAPSCKPFASIEPVVVKSVDEACSVISLITTSGVVQAVCLAWDDVVKLERELLAAQAEGRVAKVSIAGRDESSFAVEIDAAHLADALSSVSKAKLARGSK